MADEAADDNSNLVDMDDLDSFEDVFFGRKPEQAEAKEEDREVEDDSLETHEDTDAEPEDPEAEGEDEDSEPEAKEPPKKNKKSAKERIDELTAERYAAERERDAEKAARTALEQRLQALEAAQKPVEQKPEPVQAVEVSTKEAPNPNALNEKGEPVYPLGEFDPTFVRDLTRFHVEQETRAFEERQRQAAEQQRVSAEQARLRQNWQEKVNKVTEDLPDYQEQVGKLTQAFGNLEPQYGEYLASTLMQCDNGPEIMYYLSQNIGEAQKIVASGPFAATLEIGKLQARFEKTGETSNTPQKKVSEAPQPPVERARGRGGQFAVRPDTDDLDAFEKEFFKR